MSRTLVISVFLFSLSTSILYCSQTIPYENIIAREFNRIHPRAHRYTSVQHIIGQSYYAKPISRQHEAIEDLTALEQALIIARDHADRNGKKAWYYFYIWNNNEPEILILNEYIADVSHRIDELQLQLQPDYVKAIRYSSPYLLTILGTMIMIYSSQSSLFNYYFDAKTGLYRRQPLTELSLINLSMAPFITLKNIASNFIYPQ